MPIHRHTSETVACLRGRVMDEFYDDAGVLVDSIELAPSSPIAAVKDGKYEAVGEEDLMGESAIHEMCFLYPDKVRLNCYYYRHYSFSKDIQMIFCTVLGKKMRYAWEII